MDEQPKTNPLSLCMKCGSRGSVDEHFCDNCGAPLTFQGTTDPIRTIRAEGFAFREASRNPRGLGVVIAMWLILGPYAFGAGLGLIGFFVSVISGEPCGNSFGDCLFMSSVLMVFLGGVTAICSILLYRTTTNYIKRKPPSDT